MQYIIQDPDQLCSALRRGISQIYAKNSSELSFEELYRTSYNLVLVGAGSNAYNGAKDAMLSFLSASLAHLQQGVDRNTFLSSLSSLWLDYCLCIKSTSEVLMYLDRTWVKTQSLPTVHQMGLDTFCSSFMRISSTVFDYMLDAIKSDRDGHQFDHSTLKMLVEMQSLLPVKNPKRNAASLSVYSVHFEPLLIASAMEYYRQAADKINTISPSDYLQYVHTRLIAERSRVGLYLLPESLTKLESALLSEMIVKVHKKILEPSNGLHDMVRLHDLPTLHTLYYLFKSSNLPNNIVDLLPDIIQSMSKPITLQFSESVKSSHWKTQASIWIDSLYEMKVKLDQIIEIGFSRNISFESVILRSFVEAVNSIDRAPELISWYIHDSINKSLKVFMYNRAL
jgi:cullin 3